MIPPRLRRLEAADYPDAPGWFSQFLDLLNSLLVDLQNSFAPRTSLKSFCVMMPASGSAPILSIPHDLPGKPIGVTVIKSTDLTDNSALVNAPYVNWDLSADGKSIVVMSVTRLLASHNYRINIRIEQA